MMLTRKSRETRVDVWSLLPSEALEVSTGLPFFDHMLTTLLFYAGLPLGLRASGDLKHHIMEDTALSLGRAIAGAVPQRITRFSDRTVAMDDALVQVVLDIGGRPYFAGRLPNRLYTHVLRSFSTGANLTLHVRVLRGKDSHHVLEACFKALGLALADALRPIVAETAHPLSLKGGVTWSEQ